MCRRVLQNVQVSDTKDDDSSNAVGQNKIKTKWRIVIKYLNKMQAVLLLHNLSLPFGIFIQLKHNIK